MAEPLWKQVLVNASNFLADSAKRLRPLSKKEKFNIKRLESYLSKEEIKLVAILMRQGKATLEIRRLGYSFFISGKNLLPIVISEDPIEKELNKKIDAQHYNGVFSDLKMRAWQALPQFIAPTVIGLRAEKLAALLQLFSDKLHVLYLSDTESNIKEISRSISKIAPVVSSGADLHRADQGIACIELGALEDKKAVGLILDGKSSYSISVMASFSSPEIQSFTRARIAKHIGSVANKFHLAFIVKPASLEGFDYITDKILSVSKEETNAEDVRVIQKYVQKARRIDVSIPADLVEQIRVFVRGLKSKEKSLLFDVTSRLVEGVVEMVKASARMELRDRVETKDLARVFDVTSKAYK